ncbi:YihY/virulence factor BrkB family protein [Syntrophorhabdus aromaticivorans]|uniref:YihY/virulence factor BrkB family protein n=1 Tax=Syntrophorhabdus aromaticivorans TaxID=328301 RepID=UPI0003F935DD|nr:YihY/virulence factor BrkB family protein [Syntrophorhabdus aromaticivorans]
MVSRLARFFTRDILTVRLKNLPYLQALCIRYLRVFILAARKFLRDNCALRASALTYYTLLSIVPVFAMAFGIAKGFGLQEAIERRILEMAEQASWPEEIVLRILTFSDSMLDNTKGGIIAGAGFVLLCWTVVNILGRVEGSFNHIWEIRKPRTLVRKFSDYIAIVVVTPVLLIISSSVAVVVTGKMGVILHHIKLLGILGPAIFFALRLLPYVTISVMLVLNYIVMPNTRVPLRSAIAAGIITGIIYQLVQVIYIKFQIGTVHYGAIYGSFAVLPLFVVWVQVSWMIVLLGAEIAVAHESHETYGFGLDFTTLSIKSKKLLVVKVFHLIAKRFSAGESAIGPRRIACTLEIPVHLVRRILNDLTSAGLVVETTKTADHETAYQPGRTVENMTIWSILEAYEGFGVAPALEVSSEHGGKIDRCLEDISEIVRNAPENVKLKDL